MTRKMGRGYDKLWRRVGVRSHPWTRRLGSGISLEKGLSNLLESTLVLSSTLERFPRCLNFLLPEHGSAIMTPMNPVRRTPSRMPQSPVSVKLFEVGIGLLGRRF